jgi:hypothetical protein
MIFNSLPTLESQTVGNGVVVGVAFVNVGVSCCQMARHETDGSVMEVQTNPTAAFIARHASETRLRGRDQQW